MKKMKNAILTASAIAIGITAIPSAPVEAADALAICQPGVPFAYPDGGANIPWNPDQGGLGPLDNATATALVAASFQVWEDLPQSSVTYQAGAFLPEDVTVANFGPVLNQAAPNGLSEIVYDEDGSIFATLFGPGSGILGFAGPDFGNPATCELTEGSAFLNGPEFANQTAAVDIMVHEFGHYTNLGHVELNGQLIPTSEGGDTSGATPDVTTFGSPSTFVDSEVVETMYPFYFGPVVGTRTPHSDDIASLANIYPDPSFQPSTGTITGTIRAPNGVPLSGVNVIARRLDASGTMGDGDLSFTDSVSTFSGAYTNNVDPSDPNVGVYTLSNLTPGANYAVFVDVVTASPNRFSNPILAPLPGAEDYYNGASESSDPMVDDPQQFEAISLAAGEIRSGVDIVFNQPGEGDPLAVGDDGSVQLFLPFTFCVQGQAFDDVFVNANGNLTFGAPEGFFIESAGGFLDGPPRIAGLWDDLNPSAGGSVFFTTGDNEFTVTWDNVPEFFATGANSFAITLRNNGAQCVEGYEDEGAFDDHEDQYDVEINYQMVTATDGLVGLTGGLATTNGVEEALDLTQISKDGDKWVKMKGAPAVFEQFSPFAGSPFDLNGLNLRFFQFGRAIKDRFEPNNSLTNARAVELPFNSSDTRRKYTAIDPAAADIDFFRFHADAGKYLVAEVARGQIDSVLGLYYCPPTGNAPAETDGPALDRCDADTAILFAGNDDFNGLLSRVETSVPITGTYALAVTFCCDYDFDGVDAGQGGPLDVGRYILDIELFDGIPLTLGDEVSVELSGFGFDIPFDGVNYSSVFVNDNGSISFGSAPPFPDFFPSVGAAQSGPPRAAGLWTDLNTGAGGVVIASTDFATQLTIEWRDVPAFFNTGSNSFSITLFADGNIQYNYGEVSAPNAIVIGAIQGNGAPVTEVDLSATGGGSVSISPVESFATGADYDLEPSVQLDFTP